MGAGAHEIEAMIGRSTPAMGYRADIPIPLNLWQKSDGDTIAATGTNVAEWEAADTDLIVIHMPASVPNSSPILCILPTPGEFFEAGVDQDPELILRVFARNAGTGGTAQGTLALRGQLRWINDRPDPDVADQDKNVLGDPVDVLLDARVTDATAQGFRWYEIDLTGGMSTAQRRAFSQSAALQIQLGPNETVTANNAIQIFSTALRLRRHAALRKRDNRRPIY